MRPDRLAYRTTSARSDHGWEPRHAPGDVRGDPPGAGVASSRDALPRTLLPAAGPPFAMRAFISVLCIGSRFQSTSGLFTELSKNILSPLQASLPEGSGACPSLRRPRVRCASSSPQRLKGTTGCTPERDMWAGTQRAAERGGAGGQVPPHPLDAADLEKDPGPGFPTWPLPGAPSPVQCPVPAPPRSSLHHDGPLISSEAPEQPHRTFPPPLLPPGPGRRSAAS